MFSSEETENAFTEYIQEDRVEEVFDWLDQGLNEVTMPGSTGRGGALEKVIVGFLWREAGGTAVIITGVSSMETITRREMVKTKFGDKIAALLHFRINTTEDIPVDGVKGSVIPVETLFIIIE